MNAPILARRVCAILSRHARSRHVSPGRLAVAATLGASIAISAASFATTKVAVKLQGDIVPECAITGGTASGATLAAIVLPDITKPGRFDYGFTVNCNAPFDYRLEAKYGALTHSDGSAVSAGFVMSVPYDVAIYIPTDGTAIKDRCSGESIRLGQAHCRFSNSGNGIALASRSSLTLAWAPEGRLVAGQYTEKLSLTVRVSP
jgi:hypothetical protein